VPHGQEIYHNVRRSAKIQPDQVLISPYLACASFLDSPNRER